MTRFKCNHCGCMTFSLGGGRLSNRVSVNCTECGNTVAEFSRLDFTE